MKNATLLILASLSLNAFANAAPAGPASSEQCERCAEMDRLIKRAAQLDANGLNVKTVKAQDRLLTDSGGLIYDFIKNKDINLVTAKKVLELTAKLIPFATETGVLAQDNSVNFRARWNDPKDIFRRAVDELIRERRITPDEKADMLDELGAVPAPKPRR